MENVVSVKISADSSSLVKAFDEAHKSVSTTAASLNQMGSQTGKVFDTAGINAAAAALARSREELRLGAANAQAFSQASALLNNQLKSGAISKGEYSAAIARLRSEMSSTTTQAGKMGEGVRSISSVLGGLQNLVLGAFGAGQVVAFGKSLLDASLAADKLNRTLSFAAGSKTGGASEMDYLVDVSQRLGISFGQSADAYAKFAAAAKGSTMEGEGVRQGFEAVAKASTAMGLSADESNGIFLALSQMMAKGKVSAEEFRGQLGERLPIATQVAAQALGVTTAEFSKMLDTGQLVSDEFLPKFFTALDKAVGRDAQEAAGSMAAQINLMSTNWERLKRNVADSDGLFGTLTKGLAKTGAELSGSLANLFGDSAEQEEIKAQGKVFDDLRAGIERLQAAGVAFNQEYVPALKSSFVAGKASAAETVAAFAAYEKSLYALAKANVESIHTLTKEERSAQAKLAKEIAADQEQRQIEQERKTLSATDFAVAQLEREASQRRLLAAGDAGLLEQIESELQIKLKALREQALAERLAQEASVTDAVQKEAAERVGIEQSAATAVVALWDQANAVKAARTGGAIMNQGTAGEFVSSWDTNGNYVGEYADGGAIAGPGTGTSDSLLARVSNGEYIMRAASVERYGTGFMDAINRLALPRFADGGKVGGSSVPAAGGMTIQSLNVYGVSNARAFVAELKQLLRTDPGLLSVGLARAG